MMMTVMMTSETSMTIMCVQMAGREELAGAQEEENRACPSQDVEEILGVPEGNYAPLL